MTDKLDVAGGMKERWEWIKGYKGRYKVSTHGRVWSKARTQKNRGKVQPLPERIMRGSPRPKGYLYVCLYKDGKKSYHSVARLVAQTFIPNPRTKPCVNHIDAVVTNNRLDNLEWVTYAENSRHMVKLGRDKPRRGSAATSSKLTETQVLKIRALLKAGVSGSALARKYKVCIQTISFIKHRVTWQHLPAIEELERRRKRLMGKPT